MRKQRLIGRWRSRSDVTDRARRAGDKDLERVAARSSTQEPLRRGGRRQRSRSPHRKRSRNAPRRDRLDSAPVTDVIDESHAVRTEAGFSAAASRFAVLSPTLTRADSGFSTSCSNGSTVALWPPNLATSRYRYRLRLHVDYPDRASPNWCLDFLVNLQADHAGSPIFEDRFARLRERHQETLRA